MKHALALGAPLVLVLLAACGSPKNPPPKVPEESIDKESAARPRSHELPPVIHDDDNTMGLEGPAAAAAAVGSGPTPSTPEGELKTVPASGGATGPAVPPAPSPHPTAKGAKLTRVECDRIFDKYIELIAVEQGAGGESMKEAKEAMKSAISSNPAFVGFLNGCVTDLKKSNYTCAMASKTSTAWQTCIK